jgi:hypothetical protein
MRTALASAAALALLCLALPHRHAQGFTQSGGIDNVGHVIPMGHEWVTAMAGLEVIDPRKHAAATDDPRAKWAPAWRATRTHLNNAAAGLAAATAHPVDDKRYHAGYESVLSAIYGERWVDIGGMNVVKSTSALNKHDCWSAVAQEPDSVQYDHFMRRMTDTGTEGGWKAIEGSRRRFVEHFVAAAHAAPGTLRLFDGGGVSNVVTAERRFFLFGRALHELQDSFSAEHTVRTPDDGYRRVRNIKSYLCGAGAEQHSHEKATVFGYKHSGDSIWIDPSRTKAGWESYKAANMTALALTAVEATKDAWAAFLFVLSEPDATKRQQLATAQAQVLTNDWLSYDKHEVEGWYNDPAHRGPTYVKVLADKAGKGMTVDECERDVLKVKPGKLVEHVAENMAAQVECIFNIEPAESTATERDGHLHLPYYWKWKSETAWKPVPTGWQLPND